MIQSTQVSEKASMRHLVMLFLAVVAADDEHCKLLGNLKQGLGRSEEFEEIIFHKWWKEENFFNFRKAFS